MPRCRHRGARFLDQHVIMKQLRRLALHQFRADLGRIGVENHGCEFGDAFPIAIVVKKAPGFIGLVII